MRSFIVLLCLLLTSSSYAQSYDDDDFAQYVLFGDSVATISWLLRDDFLTNATNLNGTACEPGQCLGTTRTEIDTEAKLSTSGGLLVYSGGKAAPAYGDPSYRVGSVTRAGSAGTLLVLETNPPDTTKYNKF